MTIEQLLALVVENLGTLVFAVIGAACLTGIAIKEHADRKQLAIRTDRFVRACASCYQHDSFRDSGGR